MHAYLSYCSQCHHTWQGTETATPLVGEYLGLNLLMSKYKMSGKTECPDHCACTKQYMPQECLQSTELQTSPGKMIGIIGSKCRFWTEIQTEIALRMQSTMWFFFSNPLPSSQLQLEALEPRCPQMQVKIFITPFKNPAESVYHSWPERVCGAPQAEIVWSASPGEVVPQLKSGVLGPSMKLQGPLWPRL